MADFAVSPKVHSWPTHSVITLSYKRSASEYYNTDTSPIGTFITRRKTPNVMSASEQGGRNGGPDPAPSQKSEAKTMWAPQNPTTHRLSTPRGPYIRLINRTSSDLSTGIKRGSSHYFSRTLERGSLEKNYRLLNPQNLPLFCPLLPTAQRESHVSPKTPKIKLVQNPIWQMLLPQPTLRSVVSMQKSTSFRSADPQKSPTNAQKRAKIGIWRPEALALSVEFRGRNSPQKC